MAKGILFNQPFKIYRNSNCLMCKYEYVGGLKIKAHPVTNEDVIICKSCYTKLYKKNKEKKMQVKHKLRNSIVYFL